MKEVIKSRLEARSTEELKNDIKAAMKSTEEGSIIIFSVALDVLEERLSKEEYQEFEESL